MILARDGEGAERAAECMRSGGVCVLPTDTVYGFSGAAGGELDAAAKIRALKGRGDDKPFIRLVAEPSDVLAFADGPIPERLLSMWPGPLTLIVRTPSLGGTAAFRCPGDPWLRSVVAAVGAPVYSTSANRSGSPVLSSAREIAREFPSVPLVVDGGDLSGGIPSTIVMLGAGGEVSVVRQGALRV